MLTYEQKYKDRLPSETVTIIQNYFNSLNLNIKLEFSQQQTSLTWVSRVKLYYKDKFILSANGKGTSEEYCLASAYGELYERFCNKIFYFNNHPFAQKVIDKTYSIKGYYIDPKEKDISFKEAFDFSAGQFFLDNLNDTSNSLEKFFNDIFREQYIGVPFYNINNNDDIWFADPRVVLYTLGSSGMAAGNTFYEAFVQGMSELYEHFVIGRYFLQNFDKYYAINLNMVTNPLLKNIIKNIQIDNDLYIIDLSYNFNVPVLMSLIVNKKSHTISVNLGSSPIFEIALERVLTELYQGYNVDFSELKPDGQYPAFGRCDFRIRNMKWKNSQIFSPIFFEPIIEKLVLNYNFNTNIFLTGNYSNENLFKHCNKINNLNNFNVYYQNVSGCKEIYAIRIVIKNIPYLIQNMSYAKDNINCTEIINSAHNAYNMVNQYLNNQTFDLMNMINLYNAIKSFSQYDDAYFFDHIIYNNYFSIMRCEKISTYDILELAIILSLHKDALIKMQKTLRRYKDNNFIYDKLMEFTIPLRYLNNPYYSCNTIESILKFLNINIDLENYATHLKDSKYLIKNIVFADLNNLLNGYYNDYINTLALYNI